MSTDSFLARSLRWSVHTDATFMLMAHDICTRVSRAPREGCVFACVCVEILNDAAHFFFSMRSQRAAFRCGTSLLPVVHFCWTLALVCWRDAVQNSTWNSVAGPIITFPFFKFFLTCFTLTATCLVCNKYTQEGGAVFEQESKQFSTTVEMCLNTNKYGINYYVYGQEYVKNFWNYYICLFKFDFSPKSMSQFSTISKPPWIYAANNTPCMILFLYKHRNTRFKQNA